MTGNDDTKFGLTIRQFSLIEQNNFSFEEIEKGLIFGSRATGKCKAASDIDFAVIGKNMDSIIIYRLSPALEDLPLPFMFDVVNYDAVSNSCLKNKVSSYGKIFFERQLKTI